jgi:hypothetical protein
MHDFLVAVKIIPRNEINATGMVHFEQDFKFAQKAPLNFMGCEWVFGDFDGKRAVPKETLPSKVEGFLLHWMNFMRLV